MGESIVNEGPTQDLYKLRNWLVHKSLKPAPLCKKLSQFLTTRSMADRVILPEAYKQRYSTVLMDDIGKVIKKRTLLEVIDGLFKTRAHFEAQSVYELAKQKANKMTDIVEIVVCKSIAELQEISDEYRLAYEHNIKDKLNSLSNGKTYRKIIDCLFDFERVQFQSTNKVKIDAKIRGDVEFLTNKGIKWGKKGNKWKFAKCIVEHDVDYVRQLAAHYFEETDANLVDFIDKQFGESSTSGSVMKIKIEQSVDICDYYARKLQIQRNDACINRIFVATFDNELARIQKQFDDMNYGDEQTMVEWINKMHKGDKYSAFLIKMLQNCS